MKRLVVLALLTMSCASNVSPSPTPTQAFSASATAAATPVPTATITATATVPPSPTAGDPSRYGYVLVSPGRIVVRGERDTDPALAIAGEQPAASHDGKRVAFWRTGPQGNNPQELRVLEVASGNERVVTTAPAGWNGGAIAWANDDTGLLYETHRAVDPNAPAGPPVAPPSRMFSIDLSAASPTPVTDPALEFSGGLVFIPLAWNKADNVAAALSTGEGGYAVDYIVWDKHTPPAGASAVRKTRFPWQVLFSSVRPSANASLMLANDIGANVLRLWPIDEVLGAQSIEPTPNTTKSVDASWRPMTNSNDFAWVTGFSVNLRTFQTDRLPELLHRGQNAVMIAGWRADGSGILLNEIGRGIFVVDLATLKETALPHLGATTTGGVLLR